MRAMKLGDSISTIATPIARALNLPCIDPETNQLRPESRCNKARIAMNEGRFADAFYDRFWPETKNRKEPKTMQFVITKQIAIEAETAEEAMSKVNEGKTISMSVSQRPQPQPQQPQTRPVTLTGTH